MVVGARAAAGARPAPSTEPGRTPGRRLDVQGLRAVAVLLVVGYHAGLPFPGGFVGVDVFFVISGFVITAMLQREWEAQGRISFARFYLRRIKRLTPALALMVSVTVVLSALFLSPLGAQRQGPPRGGAGAAWRLLRVRPADGLDRGGVHNERAGHGGTDLSRG